VAIDFISTTMKDRVSVTYKGKRLGGVAHNGRVYISRANMETGHYLYETISQSISSLVAFRATLRGHTKFVVQGINDDFNTRLEHYELGFAEAFVNSRQEEGDRLFNDCFVIMVVKLGNDVLDQTGILVP
jgi:hypothetical protein